MDRSDTPGNDDHDDIESRPTSRLALRRGSLDELDLDEPILDYSIGRAVVGTPQVLVTRPSTHDIHNPSPPPKVHEHSPLLNGAVSFSYAPRSSYAHMVEGGSQVKPTDTEALPDQPLDHPSAEHVLHRRNSTSSCKNSITGAKHSYSGGSTYGQTVRR
jgi:hypothetical protein